MAQSFLDEFTFTIARIAIGTAVGFIFGLPGAIAGAAIAFLSWPLLRRIAWAVLWLYGGHAEPDQPAHFWSWRRRQSDSDHHAPKE